MGLMRALEVVRHVRGLSVRLWILQSKFLFAVDTNRSPALRNTRLPGFVRPPWIEVVKFTVVRQIAATLRMLGN